MTIAFYTQESVQGHQQQQMEVPCVQFSKMNFNQTRQDNHSTSTISTASTTSTASTRSSLSGWGSTISRQQYSCLKTLADSVTNTPQVSRRNIVTQQPSEEMEIEDATWGYFVDTPDNCF